MPLEPLPLEPLPLEPCAPRAPSSPPRPPSLVHLALRRAGACTRRGGAARRPRGGEGALQRGARGSGATSSARARLRLSPLEPFPPFLSTPDRLAGRARGGGAAVPADRAGVARHQGRAAPLHLPRMRLVWPRQGPRSRFVNNLRSRFIRYGTPASRAARSTALRAPAG